MQLEFRKINLKLGLLKDTYAYSRVLSSNHSVLDGLCLGYKSETLKMRDDEFREHLPANGPPQDTSRGTEMNRALARLGVHSLPQEPEVFHLLAHKATGQADLLASHNDLLTP